MGGVSILSIIVLVVGSYLVQDHESAPAMPCSWLRQIRRQVITDVSASHAGAQHNGCVYDDFGSVKHARLRFAYIISARMSVDLYTYALLGIGDNP